MAAYKLCTGQLLHIQLSREEENDPLKTRVKLESQESVLLAEFVHEAAIRWKNGEISVYIELLGLLLKQLKTAAAAFSINKQLLKDTIEDDQEEENEENEEGEEVDEGTEDPIHLDEEFEEEEEGAEAIVEEEDDIEEELDDDYVPINSKGTRRKPRTRGVKKQLPGVFTELDETEYIKLEPSLVKLEKAELEEKGRDGKGLSCPDCEQVFSAESQLKIHFQENHLNEIEKHRCFLCGMSFRKSFNVKSHILTVHRRRRDYKCGECDDKFTKRNHVVRHLELKHGILLADASTKFSECEKTCEICGEIFSKQGSLNTHIMTVHPDVKAFKCRLCLAEFDTRSEIMEHIVNLHGEEEVEENIETRSEELLGMKKFKKPLNRVSCDQCEQTFCSNHSLKTHIRTVHENIKDFSCNVCSMEFSTVSGVKRHLLTHHDITDTKDAYLNKSQDEKNSGISPAPCSMCKIEFLSPEELINHVISNHPTRPDLFPLYVRNSGPLPWSRADAWERQDWSCPLCPHHMIFRTETLNGMVSHVKLGHPNSIMCWVCGMGWSTQEGKLVYEHMKTSHPLKSLFSCEKCGVYNQNKRLLANHKKIHRMEELQGPMLSCELCDYVTPRPDILAKHRFSHRSNKTYMCDDCGKVLKSRTALATHVKLHQDDTRNQCSICFKIFSQRGYLKTHMNSHSDSKPYSCEFCAMTFFGPTNLSQHRKRAHGDMIGESPKLSCDLCTKRFWIPSELKYHRERVHEGKKDFSCTECQKRFADKKNLKKHLVNVHKARMQHFHL
ncbi:zinc finger protein 271 isoform X3 [Eurytemora carolleeae]|uniref:zinc finger protein 271 isoform X3 n=1 Tax=Eurytemora carolleeae TaxID=1294199 RepID=UPI000C77334F|nr:zinc finger protein 271 isoform X3 [Eurytemora carolleeae]|eukprot:XP_023346151.1 zinc finger protein 271-like isoform X3 [Eurytemora affinis]